DHAEQVIGVHVGEEDVLERERHSVSHHLSLRALAAVEHQRLALSMDRERTHVALDGWARRRRAEETNAERHGVNIAGDWNRFCDELHALRDSHFVMLDTDGQEHKNNAFALDANKHSQAEVAVSAAAPEVAGA